MKIILLDGNKIKSKSDVHSLFSMELAFPEWYGKNLDALHDMLTDISDEIGIIAVNTDQLEINLGKWWKSLSKLLLETSDEKAGIHILINPFSE